MLTTKNLKEFTLYNPETGSFSWSKIDTPNQTKVGDEIGSIKETHGIHYKQTSFNGSYFVIHRIIHLYMTGNWPECQIDHIDGNGLNNKWSNLRAVDHQTNMMNKKKYSSNSSGLSGVTLRKCDKKWYARISKDGDRFFLGAFDSFFEACCARISAQNSIGYHANHGRE
jgi:hypothetical protein